MSWIKRFPFGCSILVFVLLIPAGAQVWADSDKPVFPVTLSKRPARICSAFFTDAGQSFVLVTDDGQVQIWDTASGKVVRLLAHKRDAAPRSRTHAAVLTPDERILVMAGSLPRKTGEIEAIRLFDFKTGDPMGLLLAHKQSVRALAVGPAGRKLISGSADRTACIWDLKTQTLLTVLKGHTGRINAVAFSPDGRKAATGSDDGTVKIWDVDQGGLIHTVFGSGPAVTFAAFSGDGEYLVFSGHDNQIHLWDMTRGKIIEAPIAAQNRITHILPGPDGQRVYTAFIAQGDAGCQAYSLPAGQPGKRFQRPMLVSRPKSRAVIALSPDGQTLALAAGIGEVSLWDTRTGALKRIMISPDGMAMAGTAIENDLPIVLVHGFAGWGRDEILGYKYWGGFADYEQTLNDFGFKTFTAAVGPFSSNWDRACELFACIKGGAVDYGKAHAAKYGHARYGRVYPGLYPQWGEKDPQTGATCKIHLVGHSMGGQTARLLVQLLCQGSDAEKKAGAKSLASPLFDGGHDWVHSVTTISTPHDGTTLAYMGIGLTSVARQLVGVVAATQAALFEDPLYDFKLDQWGLKREPGESFVDYSERVFNNELWVQTRDTSLTDLRPEGAMAFNAWVKAQPGVWYFSVATKATRASGITGYQIPELGAMNPVLMPMAIFMGCYTRPEPGSVRIDEQWWPNDGIVNTISMQGPRLGSDDIILDYEEPPAPGKWNYLGLLKDMDHDDVLGRSTDMAEWYLDLAEFLNLLPINPGSPSLHPEEANTP